MIKRLRIKFIAASMLSLALVLLALLGGIDLMSYRKIVRDADDVLAILTANNGVFPQREFSIQPDSVPEDSPHSGNRMSRGQGLSPETPFESRFFSVVLDASGHVVSTDMGKIAAVNADTAAAYALEVLESGRAAGFCGDFRYAAGNDGRIVFLDCGRTLSNFRTTLFGGIAVSLVGLAAVLMLLIFFSKRIIRPVAESYEKQKRFITDAGHEINPPPDHHECGCGTG